MAVRYATMRTSRAKQYYRYAAYERPDEPMALDYYFWVVREAGSVVLVDCGFSQDAAAKRPDREVVLPAVEALRASGVEPDEVSQVVLSHLHYDHAGNLDAFPEARFTVQRQELDFWTGPYAVRPAVAAGVEAADIEFLVEAERRGRVDVVDGRTRVTDAVVMDLVGGHCPGQAVVTVEGPDLDTLLCSDAVHFYDEVDEVMPHHGVFDLVQMFETYELVRARQSDGAQVVPGHDAAVMTRYPPLPGADGLAVLLAG